MAESSRMSNRKLLIAIVVAMIVSLFATYWANLDITYRNGGNAAAGGFKSWLGWESFNRLQRWMVNPGLTDWISVIFMNIGMAITFI